MLALQGVHGACHRQVGFTRAGWADAEVDVVVEDGFDVALLICAAWANHALAGAQGDAGFDGRVAHFLDAGLLQKQVHQLGRQFGVFGFAVQAAQQLFGCAGLASGADQFELVAAVAQLDAQALFDQAQVLIKLAAQVSEAASLKGFKDKAEWFYGCVQGRVMAASRLG